MNEVKGLDASRCGGGHYRFMNEQSAIKFADWISGSTTAKLRNIKLCGRMLTVVSYEADTKDAGYAQGIAEGIEFADYPKMYVERY